LPHPTYLDGFALLDDYGHCAVTIAKLEHALVSFAVSFNVSRSSRAAAL
jgi:hypothetical protein